MPNFENNIFFNCPFDKDYRHMLIASVFTIKYLGFTPKLALERDNAAEARIEKIISMIDESKYGIHDLSRMVATEEKEFYRMNMPFELGIDFGCKKFKEGRWAGKWILVLDKEKYRYQKALSDLSGSDIYHHEDQPDKAVILIRNWLFKITQRRMASGNKIWNHFADFNAYLYDELVEKDGHPDIDDVEISEIIYHIDPWLEAQR